MEHGSRHMLSEHISEHINETAYLEACQLAEGTYQTFRQRPGFYNNTLDSHNRGKIGEIACEQWLKHHGFGCHAAFRNVAETEDADIIIDSKSRLRLEVKTWNEIFWGTMGRCIAVQQFSSLKAKADVVIWCITPDKIEVGMRVSIIGWNTIEHMALNTWH